MTNSRVCECGNGTIYFKEEDAGKIISCPVCERTYKIFIEFEEDNNALELFAEPEQELLLG